MRWVVGIGLFLTLMRGAIAVGAIGSFLGLAAFLLAAILLPPLLGKVPGWLSACWIYALWPLLAVISLNVAWIFLNYVLGVTPSRYYGPIQVQLTADFMITMLGLTFLAPYFCCYGYYRVSPDFHEGRVARARILRASLYAIPLASLAVYALWRYDPIGATRLFRP